MEITWHRNGSGTWHRLQGTDIEEEGVINIPVGLSNDDIYQESDSDSNQDSDSDEPTYDADEVYVIDSESSDESCNDDYDEMSELDGSTDEDNESSDGSYNDDYDDMPELIGSSDEESGLPRMPRTPLNAMDIDWLVQQAEVSNERVQTYYSFLGVGLSGMIATFSLFGLRPPSMVQNDETVVDGINDNDSGDIDTYDSMPELEDNDNDSGNIYYCGHQKMVFKST